MSNPLPARPFRRILLPLLGALLLLPAAGQADRYVGDPDPTPEVVGSIDFPARTYYRATRPDPRLCPSPLCGGFFVEKVNARATRCADGRKAKECHAAIVDLSGLGLAPDEEARLLADFGIGRVLARGELRLVDSGFGLEVPTLVVQDAWRGVTGEQGERGRYWGVVPSGIVCVTFPCPSFFRLKLNRRRVGWLHSVDLSEAGATQAQIDAGFEALFDGDGLIGFGPLRKIEGPAGKGLELVPSEFYLKVASDDGGGDPRACGGFTWPPNPPCESGEFCELPPGTCNIADLPGTCQAIPDVCPLYLDPVCGCDGRTYGNDCERQRAQVALDHPGACETRGEPCGPSVCGDGLVCCNPVMGICTPPGGFCIQ